MIQNQMYIGSFKLPTRLLWQWTYQIRLTPAKYWPLPKYQMKGNVMLWCSTPTSTVTDSDHILSSLINIIGKSLVHNMLADMHWDLFIVSETCISKYSHLTLQISWKLIKCHNISQHMVVFAYLDAEPLTSIMSHDTKLVFEPILVNFQILKVWASQHPLFLTIWTKPNSLMYIRAKTELITAASNIIKITFHAFLILVNSKCY